MGNCDKMKTKKIGVQVYKTGDLMCAGVKITRKSKDYNVSITFYNYLPCDIYLCWIIKLILPLSLQDWQTGFIDIGCLIIIFSNDIGCWMIIT